MATRRKKDPRLMKGVLIGFKITSALCSAIDQEAERVGLSRSAVIRRTLLDAFRHKLATD